jgi:ferredoxin, 2Fe-2S
MSSDRTIRVTIKDHEKTIDLPLGQSILDAALAQGVDIDHACGGVCACSTCHIKIAAGADCFREASEDEEDQLDKARDVALNSRLACQAVLERMPKDGSVEISIPEWNVNAVQEGH